jgi:hypothetical protein
MFQGVRSVNASCVRVEQRLTIAMLRSPLDEIDAGGI